MSEPADFPLWHGVLAEPTLTGPEREWLAEDQVLRNDADLAPDADDPHARVIRQTAESIRDERREIDRMALWAAAEAINFTPLNAEDGLTEIVNAQRPEHIAVLAALLRGEDLNEVAYAFGVTSASTPDPDEQRTRNMLTRHLIHDRGVWMGETPQAQRSYRDNLLRKAQRRLAKQRPAASFDADLESLTAGKAHAERQGPHYEQPSAATLASFNMTTAEHRQLWQARQDRLLAQHRAGELTAEEYQFISSQPISPVALLTDPANNLAGGAAKLARTSFARPASTQPPSSAAGNDTDNPDPNQHKRSR